MLPYELPLSISYWHNHNGHGTHHFCQGKHPNQCCFTSFLNIWQYTINSHSQLHKLIWSTHPLIRCKTPLQCKKLSLYSLNLTNLHVEVYMLQLRRHAEISLLKPPLSLRYQVWNVTLKRILKIVVYVYEDVCLLKHQVSHQLHCREIPESCFRGLLYWQIWTQ